MLEQEYPEDLVAHEKLQLLKSPLKSRTTFSSQDRIQRAESGLPNLRGFGDRMGDYENTPEFQRHEDASLLELFFDLFFAANYTVFSETQNVSSESRFKSYVGYFCMLWMTWVMVGFYDVRFLTDSLFERLAKAVHLGVMVGFAVVAPRFNPDNQDAHTMKTMSVILAVSRLTLAIEYGTILWHIRKFKKTHLGLYCQIGVHIVACLIYVGVTFTFSDEKKRGRGFTAWYIVGITEALATLFISNVWTVLSFTSTHLMRRMSLLTVIVLGDGIVVLATNVVTIVDAPHAWNSLTVGIVTAASCTIYCIFLVYFDWMKHDHLPSWRQQLWTSLHFPFHLALVLFIQGFNQFVLWSKVVDVMGHTEVSTLVADPVGLLHTTSEQVASNLTEAMNKFFETYPPKFIDAWDASDSAIGNITHIADSFWPKLSKYYTTELESDFPPEKDFNILVGMVNILQQSMQNSLFDTFNIDLHEEVTDEFKEANNTNVEISSFQSTLVDETWNRYYLVFSYAFVAAGCTLALMNILTIISRVTPWKRWPLIRTIIVFLLAIGTSLIALLYYNHDKALKFLISAWVLPTLCLVWFVVLVLTHVHGQGQGAPIFFQQSAASLFNFGKGRKSTLAFEDVSSPAPVHRNDSYLNQKPTGGHQSTIEVQPSYFSPTSSYNGSPGFGDHNDDNIAAQSYANPLDSVVRDGQGQQYPIGYSQPTQQHYFGHQP